MLTPKEKAEELIDNFCERAAVSRFIARICVNITVDEIISELEHNHDSINTWFYEEVKQELEKL